MSKLYPPKIEGVIPAFTNYELSIPYSMNGAVSRGEVYGMALKIKTVQSNIPLGRVYEAIELTNDKAVFDVIDLIQNGDIQFGNYYKCQIAYIDSNHNYGFYSTVGIVKFTTEPTVTIDDMEEGVSNLTRYNYVGHYSQEDTTRNVNDRDSSEKEFSYSFKIYNQYKQLIEDSGTKVHNSTQDEMAFESHDNFLSAIDMEPNIPYYIQYDISTRNGIDRKSPMYRMINVDTVPPDLKAYLHAESNDYNGYVDVYMEDILDSSGVTFPVNGTFELDRWCDNQWNILTKFTLNGQTPSTWHYRDMTVEHGKYYQYAIRQYSPITGLYSSKIIQTKYDEKKKRQVESKVFVTFESSFLSDGKRQLKLEFNPKISTFKTDLLESKIDTIGSKHPFIFRNGNTEYKEFPISGLISYWMDEENLFMSKKELGLEDSVSRSTTNGEKVDLKIKTTNLEDYNISAERKFKLEVLDWLNNGNVKLFRSPTEGSYLVRLLNTSLTPTDTLGRMLHTFNSTAYEIGDCNYDNLFQYGFVNKNQFNLNQMHYKNVKLYPKINSYELVTNPDVRYLKNYYIKVGSKFESASNSIYDPNMMYYEKIEKYDLRVNEELLNKDVYERVYELKDNENYYIYDPDIHKYMAITREQIDANNHIGKKEIYYRRRVVKSNMYPASSVQFNNVTPGTRVLINDDYFQIGSTGSLFVELEDGIYSVKLIDDPFEVNEDISVDKFNEYGTVEPSDINYNDNNFVVVNNPNTLELSKYWVKKDQTYIKATLDDLNSGIVCYTLKDPYIWNKETLQHNYIIDEDGEVVIGYKSDTESIFDRYENIKLIETPSQQFFGENKDIFPMIEDVKHDIVSFYQMTFIKREISYLYVKNVEYIHGFNIDSITNGGEPIFYEDAFMTHPITDWNELDSWRLYEIRLIGNENYVLPQGIEGKYLYEKVQATKDNFDNYYVKSNSSFIKAESYDEFTNYYKQVDISKQNYKGYYFDSQKDKFCSIVGSYLDSHSKSLIDSFDYNCKIDFDNDEYSTDISDTHYYHIELIPRPKLNRFYLGVGVIADVSYVMKEYKFTQLIEEGTPQLLYNDAYEEYQALTSNIVKFKLDCDKAIKSPKPAIELEAVYKSWQNILLYSSYPKYNANKPIDEVVKEAKNDIYGYFENGKWHNGIIDNYMDDFWYRGDKFENVRKSLKTAYANYAADVTATYEEYKLEHGLE